MATELTCADCGAPLPRDAPGNRCPKCLLELGLAETADNGLPDKPPAPLAEPPEPQSDSVDERIGISIGRYKLLQQIGEGGFGIVFMAEQTEPVQRKVALKVIKAGMDSREIVARFEAERQALALMDHPNIARVLDAGTTASRRPYFVMELVKGIPITEYCDQANLTTRERLELFIKVCRAVQHAHQKGVIHRDLKPGNVLVTLHDGDAVPKVIDFGVAKALGQKLTDKTLFTRFEQMIGTPAYMSPEQAALGGLDIDTRSDIYSLGVLLYELLTGVTPLDAETLRKGGLDEIRRMIREFDPPWPSTRLQTMGGGLADVARRRHTEPAALSRLVRGDLDWITMKCVEKDRQRRYETVSGLATDIERHLNNEPVVARPPGKLYEFQKTFRRHKFGFAASGAVMAALACGLVASSSQAIRARRAEQAQVRLRLIAEQAKRDATERLWGSYLAEARGRRRSGEAGQRFASLAALSNAAAIRPSLELRNEAIACMTLADVRLFKEKHFNQEYTVDDAHQRYAIRGPDGTITIRRLSDDQELLRLLRLSPGTNVWSFVGFFRNDELLAEGCDGQRIRVWDLASSKLYANLPHLFRISADAKLCADVESNGVSIYELPKFQKLKTIALSEPVTARTRVQTGSLFFAPDNSVLACVGLGGTNIFVLDIKSGTALWNLPVPSVVGVVDWHPQGRYVATACLNGLVYLWDTKLGEMAWTIEGHPSGDTSACFSHDGQLLISAGVDGHMRLWDFRTGRQLVNGPCAPGFVKFSPDDHSLVAHGSVIDAGLQFFDLLPGFEARSVYDKVRTRTEIGGIPTGNVFFSRDGRWLAFDVTDGAILYDVQAHREIGSIKGHLTVLGFGAGDQNVLGLALDEAALLGKNGVPVPPPREGEGRLFRWGIGPDGQGSARTAEALELGGKALGMVGCVSVDAKLCVSAGLGAQDERDYRRTRNRAQVFRSDTLTEVAQTDAQLGMRYPAFSPDGHLLATGVFHGSKVMVWQALTGKPVKNLPIQGETDAATVAFSPDGRRLVVGMNSHYQFWDVGTWTTGLRIKRDPSFPPMMVFSPDGSILAGTFAYHNKVQLFNSATGEALGHLELPVPKPITCLSFSPDGSQLAVCEGHVALHIWDLRAIREQLAQMRLDWDLPPYAPTPSVIATKP